jgi:hypothetical protein
MIRRTLSGIAALLLLAAVSLPAHAEDVEFTNFQPAGSDFYVSFPGKFQQTADKKSDKGIIQKTYMSQFPPRNTFIVDYILIPKGLFADNVTPDQVLDTILQKQPPNGKLRSDRRFKFKDATAAELIADFTGAQPTVGRRFLYVKHDKARNVREYQLVFIGAPGSENSPEAKRFFESFRFD